MLAMLTIFAKSQTANEKNLERFILFDCALWLRQ